MTTLYIALEDNTGVFRQEGDPIEGFVHLEDYLADVLTPENPQAGEDSGNRYNVCQISGFKVRPNELMTQWDNALVRPESYSRRNEQDFVRVHAELLQGAIRPEPEDVFVDELGFLLITNTTDRMLLNDGGAIKL